MTERLTITVSDGVTLEARIDAPSDPERFTVLCHPHPLHGGSMNAPLMIGVAHRLVERGHKVLRFNFRGVGSSTGAHDHGEAELMDISAAVGIGSEEGLPLGIAGWSFGAAAGLNWIAKEGSNTPYVGIAPPADLLPERLPDGPKTLILGTRDQVIDGAALEAYAERMGIELILTPGDHFFHGRGGKIGDLVADGLAG